MNKQTDRYVNQHPSTIVLDALRAGLLDSHPERRAAVTTHLSTCADCRRQAALAPRLLRALDQQTIDERLAAQLAARRRQALHGSPRRRARATFLGLAVAAILVAIAVGLGTIFLNDAKNPAPAAATADTPSPDLYADLDFYLWLMHKQSHGDKSPNG